MEHERRRVRASQRSIERERRQRKWLRPALGRDNLKYVASLDVLTRRLDGSQIILFGEVRHRLGRHKLFSKPTIAARQVALQIANRVHHPFSGLCISGARVLPRRHPGRSADNHLALHTVQDGHHRGSQQDCVRHAEHVRIDVRQMLDETDHVVAQIPEQPGRSAGKPVRQVDTAFSNERAQRRQRVRCFLYESLAVKSGVPIDP